MEEIIALKQLRETIQLEPGVVVYFFNDDCPPCISLRPKVESLVADRFPEMKLLWVNSKSSPEIPVSFGVFANPAILIFFEGKEFRRFSKYVSIPELEQAIARYYEMIF
jgi:thioredoxin-like negative regulator of GroEL